MNSRILTLSAVFLFSRPIFSVAGPTNGIPPSLSPNVKSLLTLREGTRGFRLNCPVISETQVFVEWRKDGELIGPGWLNFKNMESGELKLKKVQREDSGTYRCKAVNGFGAVEFEYKIHVTGQDDAFYNQYGTLYSSKESAPYWTDSEYIGKLTQAPLIKAEGSQITLKCDARGFPSPDVVWTKEGTIIKEDWSGNFDLALENLQSSDSGKYMCKVSNIFGSRNASFTILVTSGEIVPPEFHQRHPQNSTVSVGQTALFYCKVKSTVPPRIQWLRRIDSPTQQPHDSNLIYAKGHNYSILENYPNVTLSQPNGTWLSRLTLPSVDRSHSGWYVCVVTNLAGHMIYRSAFLKVDNDSSLPIPHNKLPWHIVVGIPVAAVLIVVVCYAIWFLKKNQQKQETGSTPSAHPPLPAYPPPALPPQKSYSPHSREMYKMYQHLDPQAAMPLNGGHFGAVNGTTLCAGANCLDNRDMYEATPLPCADCMHQQHQPMDLSHCVDFTDSYSDLTSPNRIQHYPSLYSCRT